MRRDGLLNDLQAAIGQYLSAEYDLTQPIPARLADLLRQLEQPSGRSYAWDLRPQSTMTNANVEHAVTAVDGQTLTLRYKDGEKKIIVPPEATVVTYTTGDKSELKPGTKIFIAAAKKLPDGSIEAPRINYGKDGLTPPM